MCVKYFKGYYSIFLSGNVHERKVINYTDVSFTSNHLFFRDNINSNTKWDFGKSYVSCIRKRQNIFCKSNFLPNNGQIFAILDV